MDEVESFRSQYAVLTTNWSCYDIPGRNAGQIQNFARSSKGKKAIADVVLETEGQRQALQHLSASLENVSSSLRDLGERYRNKGPPTKKSKTSRN